MVRRGGVRCVRLAGAEWFWWVNVLRGGLRPQPVVRADADGGLRRRVPAGELLLLLLSF